MANCEVCNQTESKYKCPQCKIKYCSINCFKLHRLDDQHKQKEDPKEKIPDTNQELVQDNKKENTLNCSQTPEYNTILENSKELQELLTYNAVKYHLHKVYRILTIQNGAGITDNEAKRDLAIEYLNTLRVGGIHHNEAVEEFCQLASQKLFN